jgi:hypothetical protein
MVAIFAGLALIDGRLFRRKPRTDDPAVNAT